jgi:hypothetical protein
LLLLSSNTPRKDLQFSHFGVLNEGRQGRGPFFSSITINMVIALVLLMLSAAAKMTQQYMKLTRLEATVLAPLKPTPQTAREAPRPPIVKTEPSKINVPKIEVPEPPKIQQVVMKAPMPTPAPVSPKVKSSTGSQGCQYCAAGLGGDEQSKSDPAPALRMATWVETRMRLVRLLGAKSQRLLPSGERRSRSRTRRTSCWREAIRRGIAAL